MQSSRSMGQWAFVWMAVLLCGPPRGIGLHAGVKAQEAPGIWPEEDSLDAGHGGIVGDAGAANAGFGRKTGRST